jgi:hypothetical protein
MGLTMTSTVPLGRGSLNRPRHFVPGYYQPVPPGQSHSPIEHLPDFLLTYFAFKAAKCCSILWVSGWIPVKRRNASAA